MSIIDAKTGRDVTHEHYGHITKIQQAWHTSTEYNLQERMKNTRASDAPTAKKHETIITNTTPGGVHAIEEAFRL